MCLFLLGYFPNFSYIIYSEIPKKKKKKLTIIITSWPEEKWKGKIITTKKQEKIKTQTYIM
jgi:hypothetical protein